MIKKQLLASVIAATLSTGMIASVTTSVFAADDQPATTGTSVKDQTMNKQEDKDFVKISEDALTSMHDVNGARLAIFNGQPEKALTYVDAAVTRIGVAVKDADKYALDAKEPKTDDSYVPFDANLTVLKDFEPTASNKEQIAKANAHLHKGEKQAAIEDLKLAQIDVAVTTRMIPVKFVKEQIGQAAKLVADHKYYEANLALKAVDDAVVIETYAIDSVPKPKGAEESKS